MLVKVRFHFGTCTDACSQVLHILKIINSDFYNHSHANYMRIDVLRTYLDICELIRNALEMETNVCPCRSALR